MKRIFIDMDGVLVDLGAEFDKWFDEHPNLVHKYKHCPDHIPGIFRDPKPYDGAINAINKLVENYENKFPEEGSLCSCLFEYKSALEKTLKYEQQ